MLRKCGTKKKSTWSSNVISVRLVVQITSHLPYCNGIDCCSQNARSCFPDRGTVCQLWADDGSRWTLIHAFFFIRYWFDLDIQQATTTSPRYPFTAELTSAMCEPLLRQLCLRTKRWFGLKWSCAIRIQHRVPWLELVLDDWRRLPKRSHPLMMERVRYLWKR